MKTVIAGLEEGLNAIAEAIGGGGEGAVVPVPTLADDGKVLRVVSQSQETVAPEWDTAREVPSGGNPGQVLTRSSNGYEWANASASGGVYYLSAQVQIDDKSGDYFAYFEVANTQILGTTRLLALYDDDSDPVLKTISTGYSVSMYPLANAISIVFDSDPGVTVVQAVFSNAAIGA